MQRGAIGVEHDWYAVDHASGNIWGERVNARLANGSGADCHGDFGWTPVSVFAQNAVPPNATTEKTIGVPSTPDATKVEPALIVMNAVGATLTDNKLTLTGVAPNAIIFADRPTRAAGHALTVHLLEEWGDAADASFAKDPPMLPCRRSARTGLLPEMPWSC